MANEERGVVKPPNEGEWKSDRRAGSYPLAGSASPVNPPNEAKGGDWRMGSYPLGGQASPVMPPNQTGGDRRGGSLAFPTPTAIEPGKGAVPVNPGIAGRGPMAPAEMKRGR